MFGSVILDTAVGLVLIYLLLSLVSACIREWFAGVLKIRSTTLATGMHQLLGDEQLMKDLYEHPLIVSLYRGNSYEEARKNRDLPSYIPARTFSAALLDLIVRGRDVKSPVQAGAASRVMTVENVRAQIAQIANVRVQRAVLSAIDSAEGDLGTLQNNIEHWFDSTMDRVSGWYKQRTQLWIFLIGLILVIIADADSLSIARRLYVDPAQHQVAVGFATSMSKGTGDSVTLSQANAKLEALSLPLVGWNAVPLQGIWPTWEEFTRILLHSRNALFGWIITALAISLGAPFWFDTLNKIMIVRSTIKPHQKSPEEGSADRQLVAPSVLRGAVPSGTATIIAPASMSASTGPPVPATPHDSDGWVPNEWASGHPDAGVL
ncbi:MAG: hypothetical protein M3Y64_01220 [Gemmatimonadota bacterium]|nr:hypothetical protein [Gemmatimonadota bacterium]